MPASTSLIPFEVLCRLWHLSNVFEDMNVAADFANIHLGRIVEGGGDGRLKKSFALHDLQVEFCAGLYCSSRETFQVDGHALRLSSFQSLMVSKYGKSGAAVCVQFCFQDLQSPDASLQDYLSDNLIRHIFSVVPTGGSPSFGEGVPSDAA